MAEAVTEDMVLARLAAGQALDLVGGEWRQGRRAVPVVVLNALERGELVAMAGCRAVLTELGRLRVERAAAPDAPNRKLAERGRAGRERVVVNADENPLGWLARRGMLTERQFGAAERLRNDFLRAGRAPQVTMRWSPRAGRRSGPVDQLDATETQVAALRRFETACGSVGLGLRPVLERVVCLGEGLTAAERAFGWPARAGKVVLAIALDRLAEHYDGGGAERRAVERPFA